MGQRQRRHPAVVGLAGHHRPHGHPGGAGGRRRGRGDGAHQLAGGEHGGGDGDPVHAPTVSGQDRGPVPGLWGQRGHPGGHRLPGDPERAGGPAVLPQPQRRRGGGPPGHGPGGGGSAQRPGLHSGGLYRQRGDQEPRGADRPDGPGHLHYPDPGQGVRPDR